jgi:hypothetical protein
MAAPGSFLISTPHRVTPRDGRRGTENCRNLARMDAPWMTALTILTLLATLIPGASSNGAAVGAENDHAGVVTTRGR